VFDDAVNDANNKNPLAKFVVDIPFAQMKQKQQKTKQDTDETQVFLAHYSHFRSHSQSSHHRVQCKEHQPSSVITSRPETAGFR
jgi:hypothetical protein